MSERDLLALPKIVTVSFAVEPVYIVLDTLESLNTYLDCSGTSEWIHRTAPQLSPELTRELQTVCACFILPTLMSGISIRTDDFAAFIDDIASRDPAQLRDEYLTAMVYDVFGNTARLNKLPPPPSTEKLFANPDVFSRWVELTFGEKWRSVPILQDYHDIFTDPVRYQTTIVNFLRRMWYGYLQEDWERHRAMLAECVRAYQQLNLSGLTALEAIRAVTGRDVSTSTAFDFSVPEHLLFLPSAHLGPYLSKFGNDSTLRIIFGARLPTGVAGPAALSRSEVLVRLNALADDTRLRILELLAQEGELRSQDIIARLELGQSSVSRHLTQLCATGYVVERRRDVNKSFTLNADRLDDTFQALKRLLKR